MALRTKKAYRRFGLYWDVFSFRSVALEKYTLKWLHAPNTVCILKSEHHVPCLLYSSSQALFVILKYSHLAAEDYGGECLSEHS